MLSVQIYLHNLFVRGIANLRHVVFYMAELSIQVENFRVLILILTDVSFVIFWKSQNLVN